MASWLHSHLFCKQIFPCGKSQYQSRAIQHGLPLVALSTWSALSVVSSWVAGNRLCQERAQATALRNVVIKRDSQCPPHSFVLILLSSPLQSIMRGWIPWIITNQIVFFFCLLSVSAPQFLGCSFPGCQVSSQAAAQKCATQLANFWPWARSGASKAGRVRWVQSGQGCTIAMFLEATKLCSHPTAFKQSPTRTMLALCP